MAKYDWIKLLVKLIAVIFIAVGAKGAAMLTITPSPPPMWKTLVFLEVIANVGNFLYGFFTDGLKQNPTNGIKPP